MCHKKCLLTHNNPSGVNKKIAKGKIKMNPNGLNPEFQNPEFSSHELEEDLKPSTISLGSKSIVLAKTTTVPNTPLPPSLASYFQLN